MQDYDWLGETPKDAWMETASGGRIHIFDPSLCGTIVLMVMVALERRSALFGGPFVCGSELEQSIASGVLGRRARCGSDVSYLGPMARASTSVPRRPPPP